MIIKWKKRLKIHTISSNLNKRNLIEEGEFNKDKWNIIYDIELIYCSFMWWICKMNAWNVSRNHHDWERLGNLTSSIQGICQKPKQNKQGTYRKTKQSREFMKNKTKQGIYQKQSKTKQNIKKKDKTKHTHTHTHPPHTHKEKEKRRRRRKKNIIWQNWMVKFSGQIYYAQFTWNWNWDLKTH